MTDVEFWREIRRAFLALAATIEKRHLTDKDELPRSEEPRTVASHRR